MANAVTACFLAAGVSMSRTVLALEYSESGEPYPQKPSEELEWVVLDLHKATIIELDSRYSLGGSKTVDFGKQCKEFRECLEGWLQGEYIL